jgi:hypothetical protein
MKHRGRMRRGTVEKQCSNSTLTSQKGCAERDVARDWFLDIEAHCRYIIFTFGTSLRRKRIEGRGGLELIVSSHRVDGHLCIVAACIDSFSKSVRSVVYETG